MTTPDSFGFPTHLSAKVRPAISMLSQTVAQTITTATWTAIIFDTVSENTAGGQSINLARSTTQILVPPGYNRARASFRLGWANVSLNYRGVQITKNGTSFLAVIRRSQNESATSAISRWISVNPGDYFDMLVWHDRGSNLNTAGSAFGGPSVLQIEFDNH